MSVPSLILILAFLLGAGIAVTILCGEARWKSNTRAMRARVEAGRLPTPTMQFDTRELACLPVPVQRYFNAVLVDRQRIIAAVTVEQIGTFNLDETTAKWMPFTATQRVATHRPGFDWDARIRMLPGAWVRVHDAYIAGEGMLHAAVFGLISMAHQRDTGEMALGELMRYFAECPWYPTALLPSQGIVWRAVDEDSAHATLQDGDLKITLLFRFSAEGLIDTVYAEARGRASGAKTMSMPWQGRFWNYAKREGMRVPLEAEVAWIHPDGAKPYWRGRITHSAYEFAHAARSSGAASSVMVGQQRSQAEP